MPENWSDSDLEPDQQTPSRPRSQDRRGINDHNRTIRARRPQPVRNGERDIRLNQLERRKHEYHVPEPAPPPPQRRDRVHFQLDSSSVSPTRDEQTTRPSQAGNHSAANISTQRRPRERSPQNVSQTPRRQSPPTRVYSPARRHRSRNLDSRAFPSATHASFSQRPSSPLRTHYDDAWFRNRMDPPSPASPVYRGPTSDYEYHLPERVTPAVWRDVYLDDGSRYTDEAMLRRHRDESERRRIAERYDDRQGYFHDDVNRQRRPTVEVEPARARRVSSADIDRIMSRQQDSERHIMHLEEELDRLRQNEKIRNREKRTSQVRQTPYNTLQALNSDNDIFYASLQPQDNASKSIFSTDSRKEGLLEELGKLKLDELLERNRLHESRWSSAKPLTQADDQNRAIDEASQLQKMVKSYVIENMKEIATPQNQSVVGSVPEQHKSGCKCDSEEAGVQETPIRQKRIRTRKIYIIRDRQPRRSRFLDRLRK